MPEISRELARKGYTGVRYPSSMLIHRLAMAAAHMHKSAKSGSWCDNAKLDQAKKDTKGSNPACGLQPGCDGMCGNDCCCWSWVCGDCCVHQGCQIHDNACASCYNGSDILSGCPDCLGGPAVFVAVLVCDPENLPPSSPYAVQTEVCGTTAAGKDEFCPNGKPVCCEEAEPRHPMRCIARGVQKCP